MFGLRLFRPTASNIDCDECHRRFPVSEGGVCSRCGRILCGTHLYGGSKLRRLLADLRPGMPCVRCRQGPAQGAQRPS